MRGRDLSRRGRSARLALMIAACIAGACIAAPRGEEGMEATGVEGIVLGIAQDGGVPQIGDRCANCEAARRDGARRHRVAALGVIDRDSGKAYLIDATPHFPEQWEMLREDLEPPAPGGRVAPDGIFLTHAHTGHYLGLAQLGREAFGARGVPVHATASMIRFLSGNAPWELLVRLGNISLTEVRPGEPVRLGEGLSITPVLSPHRQEYSDTVGYLVEGKRRLLYVPDTDAWEGWERSITDWCREVDYAILDGTFYSGGELPGRDLSRIPHPFVTTSMEMLGEIAREHPGRIHFTHLNHTNPLLVPEGEERARLEEMGFRVAREGMRFPL